MLNYCFEIFWYIVLIFMIFLVFCSFMGKDLLILGEVSFSWFYEVNFLVLVGSFRFFWVLFL